MERVTSPWHLCLIRASSSSRRRRREDGSRAFLGEAGKGVVLRTGSRRGLFQWQVIGRGSHRAFFCLFVYTYISHGITVLVFNDV